MENEYLFIYDGEMWWLKLTDVEQIIDYHKQTGGRYEGAVNLYMKFRQEGKEWYNLLDDMPLQERIEIMQRKDFKYLQCAIIKAQQVEGTIFDGFRCLNMEIGAGELETIREHGAVFINQAGGHTWGIKTVQFCRRKQLVFPHFKREEIRIKQRKDGRLRAESVNNHLRILFDLSGFDDCEKEIIGSLSLLAGIRIQKARFEELCRVDNIKSRLEKLIKRGWVEWDGQKEKISLRAVK